jgi:hypothetical protein
MLVSARYPVIRSAHLSFHKIVSCTLVLDHRAIRMYAAPSILPLQIHAHLSALTHSKSLVPVCRSSQNMHHSSHKPDTKHCSGNQTAEMPTGNWMPDIHEHTPRCETRKTEARHTHTRCAKAGARHATRNRQDMQDELGQVSAGGRTGHPMALVLPHLLPPRQSRLAAPLPRPPLPSPSRPSSRLLAPLARCARAAASAAARASRVCTGCSACRTRAAALRQRASRGRPRAESSRCGGTTCGGMARRGAAWRAA